MATRIASQFALLAALLLAACANRTVETRILDVSGVEVFLRHRLEGGREVERGYSHPLTISAERLSVILSQIQVESDRHSGLLNRKTARQRQAAILARLLEPVAGALAEALAQAGPNQQIALRAVEERRQTGIFLRQFATGFTAFADHDTLHLRFAFVDWEVPVVGDDDEETLPMPGAQESVMAVRVLPGRDMQRISAREVAVGLRSASVEPLESRVSEPALASQLDAATLRELADLEEARENGEISESYYQRQRENLLGRGDPR